MQQENDSRLQALIALAGKAERAQEAREAERPGRRTFQAHRLRAVTQGRLERMRQGGAPAWLIRAERKAQSQGFTMRRGSGCGEHWFRFPFETGAEYDDRAKAAQEARQDEQRRVQDERERFDQFDDIFEMDR